MYRESTLKKKNTRPKRTKFVWLLFLFLFLAMVFGLFIFKQKIVNFISSSKFFEKEHGSPPAGGLPQDSEQKIEEPKSVAIYCPIKESLDTTDQTIKTRETVSTTSEAVTTVTIREQNLPGREEKVERCFHLDEAGVIFKEAPIISGGPFLVIYDKIKQNLKLNEQAVKPEVLKFILQIKQKIHLNLANFMIISPISDDIEVLTAEGWKIYFDASKDADKQLEILDKILTQKNKPAEYVDLRLENKVYFK